MKAFRCDQCYDYYDKPLPRVRKTQPNIKEYEVQVDIFLNGQPADLCGNCFREIVKRSFCICP